MSKNAVRLIGFIMMIMSVFFIIGGLFLNDSLLPRPYISVFLWLGIILLVSGVIFYKVLKSDETI